MAFPVSAIPVPAMSFYGMNVFMSRSGGTFCMPLLYSYDYSHGMALLALSLWDWVDYGCGCTEACAHGLARCEQHVRSETILLAHRISTIHEHRASLSCDE